jgi:hypothetical protein
MSEKKNKPRNWRVMRFCCTSGMCIHCRAVARGGDVRDRLWVVHADRVTKDYAQECAKNWPSYGAKAEVMPDAPDGTIFDTYRLPSGELVRCDASACKGRRVIDFTLEGGTIVPAVLYARGAR